MKLRGTVILATLASFLAVSAASISPRATLVVVPRLKKVDSILTYAIHDSVLLGQPA
jgi:hypothetical protein